MCRSYDGWAKICVVKLYVTSLNGCWYLHPLSFRSRRSICISWSRRFFKVAAILFSSVPIYGLRVSYLSIGVCMCVYKRVYAYVSTYCVIISTERNVGMNVRPSLRKEGSLDECRTGTIPVAKRKEFAVRGDVYLLLL